VFLVIPDSLLNGYVVFEYIAVVAMNNIDDGNAKHLPLLSLYIWVFFFYYTSNFYLNAIVAYEINAMAYKSFHRRKTNPPPLRRVYIQTGVVYILSALFATWFVIPYRWAPMKVLDEENLQLGFGEKGFGQPQRYFQFLAVVITVFAIPALYVLYVAYNMFLRNKEHRLLPRLAGKTRSVSLYFMRILVVFFAFYVPCVVMGIVVATTQKFRVLIITLVLMNFFFAMQIFATLYLSTKKRDIHEALSNFWCVRCFCCCNCRCNRRRTDNNPGVNIDYNNNDIDKDDVDDFQNETENIIYINDEEMNSSSGIAMNSDPVSGNSL